MIIENRRQLIECLKKDAIANKRKSIHRKIYADDIWKFIWLLRVNEYYSNIQGVKKLFSLPFIIIRKIQYHRKSLLLNYTIPLNRIDAGLSLAHPGTIIINGQSKIGKNCRIQTGVTIGSTNGKTEAPIIGNNVFLGDGCKIIGNIRIADDVQIGANAVVVKDICEKGTTWAGVPAKKISNNSSKWNLNKALYEECYDEE